MWLSRKRERILLCKDKNNTINALKGANVALIQWKIATNTGWKDTTIDKHEYYMKILQGLE